MNEDGSCDGRIIEAYPDLIRNYPEAEKVIANPLASPASDIKVPRSALSDAIRMMNGIPPERDIPVPPLIPPDFEIVLRPVALRNNAAMMAKFEGAIKNDGNKSGYDVWPPIPIPNPYQ